MRNRQRLFDKSRVASCGACGILIAIAPSKNGVQCKYDLDDESNPTFTPHKCRIAEVKKEMREKERN